MTHNRCGVCSYLASNFSSSSESSAGASMEAGEFGDCGKDGPLPDSYSSSVGPAAATPVHKRFNISDKDVENLASLETHPIGNAQRDVSESKGPGRLGHGPDHLNRRLRGRRPLWST